VSRSDNLLLGEKRKKKGKESRSLLKPQSDLDVWRVKWEKEGRFAPRFLVDIAMGKGREGGKFTIPNIREIGREGKEEVILLFIPVQIWRGKGMGG